jgi:hypothetical protein
VDYSNEIVDGGTTFYTNIPSIVDPELHPTAVFVPDQFHTTTTIDVILYLHGYTSYADLRSYIRAPFIQPLRQAVSGDGRFALAIPWLKHKSDAKHIVGSTQAFDMYLNAVIALIQGQRPGDVSYAVSPSVNLVLAAHSGGGWPMSQAIALPSGYINNVVSAWGFDCFYNDSHAAWAGWATAKPNSTMFVYYRDGEGTAANSRALDTATASLTNVSVQTTTVSHPDIPKAYFPDLLSTL